MKNNRDAPATPRPGYGPTPTPGRRAAAAPLSTARAAVYELLVGQPEPVGLAALARLTHLHSNTLREHLQAMVEAGIVRRERAEPEGRGRPAWLYRAVDDVSGHEYAGLAAALAASIQRTSRHPRDDAIAAGDEWGRSLVRESPQPEPGGDPEAVPATERVLRLLDRIGFAPRQRDGEGSDRGDATFRLTHCPLLDAAHRHPEVVCGVHLGIVRGALAECGDDSTDSDLVPFAEPGACLLHLTAASTEPAVHPGSDAP